MKFITAIILLIVVALGVAQNTDSQATALPTSKAPTTVPVTQATTATATATPATAATATPATPATATPATATPATAATATPAKNGTTGAPKTTAVPTTQPPPPTTLPPPSKTWSVANKQGVTCIIATFYARFTGTYDCKNNTKGNFDFIMPENAIVDAKSRCGSATQTAVMILTWLNAADSLALEFNMDAATQTFQLKSANANLSHTAAHFPDSNTTGAVAYGGVPTAEFFKTKLGFSFECSAIEQIPYKENDFKLIFSQLKVQPFEVDGTFSKGSPCPADHVPAHWGLKDNKNAFCLLADFQLTFTGEYTKNDSKMYPFTFVLPQNALIDTAKSHCGDSNAVADDAVLVLTFDTNNSFTQVYQLDSKAKTFSLVNATAMLLHDDVHFPDSKDAGKTVTYGGVLANQFQTGLGSYYQCAAIEKVEFKDKFALNYADMKVQPFDVDKTYGNLSQCSQDTPTARPALPPMGNWTISSGGKKCMLMQFAAQFIISYSMKDMNKSKVGYYLPNNTLDTHLSNCSNKSAKFVGAFSPDELKTTKDWVMTLEFTMDKNNNYAMTNFTLEYMMDTTYFPGINETMAKKVTVFNATKRFDSTAGNYYMCNADQDIVTGSVTATFMKTKLQPFAQQVKGGGLGSPSDCSADNDVSNIVPIAVGCALAGLVIIVLIAYLIGRSRSNRTGYQSV